MTNLAKERIKIVQELMMILERNLILKNNFERRIDSKSVDLEFNKLIQVMELLLNIDFEDVKFIKTIMYIGSHNNFSNEEVSPEEIYERTFNNFNWSETTHLIEATLIEQNHSLADCLAKGLKNLQLS